MSRRENPVRWKISGSGTMSVYPHVLVVDVGPPGWAAVKSVLCEALRNVLCLAASAAHPGERISVYTVRDRHQCLLPLLEMRGNLCRLQRCLSELQAIALEGSGAVRVPSLSLAVLDALQQNRQRMQHGSSGAAGGFVEVTIVSTRPRCDLLHDLDRGLKEGDLSTLRRLLLLHVSCDVEENRLEPEMSPDQEIMCDMSRPLLDPGLLHGAEDEMCPRGQVLTSARVTQEYRVIRAVSSPGVCGSMFYGLPAILTPTACWELDWEQLEANQDNFHALCHSLQSQQLSLVASSVLRDSSCAPPVMSHVLVSASASAALLLRTIAVRELILLTRVPTLPAAMAQHALHRVQDALGRLEAEPVYNPLQISSNLYRHLQVAQSSRRQNSLGRGRQVVHPSGRARATIAPLQFKGPGLNMRRCGENDIPSPKRRLLCDKED
ncbi:meiosis 1 arrest protein isoform X4 [Engystomops pustulosus]|uniref:meiosis 1 arrest protein isoform X4 n=1 Tax=Engystomops pustulosus TaxID=76066 RepID=UPI003AFA23BC